MNKTISFDAVRHCFYTFKGRDAIIDISDDGDIGRLAAIINENDRNIPLFVIYPSDLGAIGTYRLVSPYQTLSHMGKIKLIMATALYKPDKELIGLHELYNKTERESRDKKLTGAGSAGNKYLTGKLKLINESILKKYKKLNYFIGDLTRMGISVSGVIFNRVYDWHVIDFLQYLKDRKIKIIIDNDDLIQDLPDFNLVKLHIEKEGRKINYIKSLKLADRLTVSTEFLEKNISELTGKEVLVYPNMVKLEDLNGANLVSFNNIMEFAKNKQPDKNMRILYAGSNTHSGDFEKYKWLFLEMADDGRFKLVFKGYIPEFLKEHPNAETHPWETFNIGTYYSSLAGLNCHAGIIPLVEHDFNRAKSNVKLVEMGALGIPAICANFKGSPYSNAPVKFNFKNRNGILKMLARLYENENNFYLKQVKNSFKYFEHYCLEKNIYRLDDLLCFILN